MSFRVSGLWNVVGLVTSVAFEFAFSLRSRDGVFYGKRVERRNVFLGCNVRLATI